MAGEVNGVAIKNPPATKAPSPIKHVPSAQPTIKTTQRPGK